MEIELFGAAKEVTGSCFGIHTNNEKILVDCGMFQGGKEMIRMNYENFKFEPKRYNALLLTHAHLDHCGRIPKLVKYGFKGKIYATEETKELAAIIMMDSAKIAQEDTYYENKRRKREGLPARKPIYGYADVSQALRLFVVVDYQEEVRITKNITAKFYDAGHILGAASVQIKVKEGNKNTILAFSGDLGQKDSILVKNAQPIEKADYVFIESTYGDRLHPPREKRIEEFIRVIKDTYKRGGKLMIPSFAVERTQEVLYGLGEFMKKGIIPKMPVYLDSPMAIKATAVFTKYLKNYNADVKRSLETDDNAFDFPELIKTLSVEDSKKINFVTEPCIIIAGNGMCTGGRIKHHIKQNIEDPKNTLLFIGYQVRGTLGYWIKNHEKRIRLLGEERTVNAQIEAIEGFSAHGDYSELLAWLKYFKPKPKKVFIIHGDVEQSQAFLKNIQKEKFTGYIPNMFEKITL